MLNNLPVYQFPNLLFSNLLVAYKPVAYKKNKCTPRDSKDERVLVYKIVRIFSYLVSSVDRKNWRKCCNYFSCVLLTNLVTRRVRKTFCSFLTFLLQKIFFNNFDSRYQWFINDKTSNEDEKIYYLASQFGLH